MNNTYGLLKRGDKYYVERFHWVRDEDGITIGEVTDETIPLSKQFYWEVMNLDWAHIDKDKYIEERL